MQTGWRHDDPKVQREFERLTKKKIKVQTGVVLEEKAPEEKGKAPTLPSGSGEVGPAVMVQMFSPLETIHIQRSGQKFFLERPLELLDNGEAVHSEFPAVTETVEHINFVDTATLHWNISYESPRQIMVKGTVIGGGAGGGTMNTWELGIDADPTITVADADEVRLIAGTGIDLTRVGRSITIDATASFSYSWIVKADGYAGMAVYDGDTVTFKGTGGATVSQTGQTITIDVPTGACSWTIKDEGIGSEDIACNDELLVKFAGTVTGGVGNTAGESYVIIEDYFGVYQTHDEDNLDFATGLAIVEMQFENETENKPEDYTGRVWFDLTSPTTQKAKIEAWYKPGTGDGYSWFAATADEPSLEIADGDTLWFIEDGYIDVYRSGNNIYFNVERGAGYELRLQVTGYSSYLFTGNDTLHFTTGTPGSLELKQSGNTVEINNEAYWYLYSDYNFNNGIPREEISANGNGTTTVTFVGGTGIGIVQSGSTITISATGGYSWYIQGEANTPVEVEDTDTVTITGTGSVTVTQVGHTINIHVPAGTGGDMSSWDASDGTNTVTVEDTDVVTWQGGDGIAVTLDVGTNTFTIENTYAFSWKVYVDENYEFTVDDADNTLNFVGSGVAVVTRELDHTIKIHVPPGGYSWNVQGGAGPLAEVVNGETVFFTGSGIVTVSQNGQTIDINVPKPTLEVQNSWDEDNEIYLTGNEIKRIQFENATEERPEDYTKRVWFNLEEPFGGTAKIEGWYKSGSGSGDPGYTWTASDGSSTSEILDEETVTWIGGSGITVVLNPVTNTFTITNTYSYKWHVKAKGESGIDVENADTVEFEGLNGIVVRRSGNTIQILRDEEYDGGYPTGPRPRVMMDFIEFDTADEAGKPPWRYGHRKRVNIVHNWDLPNMHAYTLQLFRVSLDANQEWDPLSIPPKGYFRSGQNSMAGENLSAHRFEYIPEIVSVDKDTVAVEVTQSRLKPTKLVMWYVLREA